MSESERRSDGEVEDPWDEMRKREIEREVCLSKAGLSHHQRARTGQSAVD